MIEAKCLGGVGPDISWEELVETVVYLRSSLDDPNWFKDCDT